MRSKFYCKARINFSTEMPNLFHCKVRIDDARVQCKQMSMSKALLCAVAHSIPLRYYIQAMNALPRVLHRKVKVNSKLV